MEAEERKTAMSHDEMQDYWETLCSFTGEDIPNEVNQLMTKIRYPRFLYKYRAVKPFGYRIENGKAVIDEAAAAQVRDLYKNYLSGLSLTNAAKEAGLDLLHAGAKRMMLNMHYLGDDFYPAIIDPAFFDAVSAELTKRSTKLGRNDVNAPYQVPYKLKAASAALLHCFFGFLTTSGNFFDHGSRSSKNDRSLSSMRLGISVRRCSKYSYGFRLFAFAVSAML